MVPHAQSFSYTVQAETMDITPKQDNNIIAA